MDDRENQFKNLSSGGAWCRQPWNYNLIDWIGFRPDGTGILGVG
jgi:hypothetical protein